MLRHRQLLALVLVAVYAAVSAFGMGFVICVEGDGRQIVEALGAACCVSVDTAPVSDAGHEDSVSASNAARGDCGDCQAHLPAVDLDATTIRDARHDASSSVLLPPPLGVSATARPGIVVRHATWRPPPGPLRPPPALARLRTVVLRS